MKRILLGFLIAVLLLFAALGKYLFAQEQATKQKSLKSELPRIAATEPDQAFKTFKVQDGFQLQLVASEPLVSDPVDACFDAQGRMFVCEMHGYPYSQEPTRLYPSGGGKPDAGIIRLLTDTNGDGKLDQATAYADGIRWPTSVICYQGGVFVLAPPRLWYFKDTTGDGVADVRKVIYDGFGRDNVQGLANNMKWGLDHRIYLAGGRNPSKILFEGKQIITAGRSDFSFAPHDPSDVRAETGGAQFGHTFDEWGNRFVCSNSNHIQQIVMPYEFTKTSSIPFSGMIRSISAEGAASTVFRRSSAEPWRIVRTRRRVADPRYKNLPATERVPIGFFTSATGISVYKGNAWPARYRGQVFIGDVGGNLVHRKILKPDGVPFKAFRADQNAEFIASTDNWFRPTNFVNAPDGTLYVLDMYRETIEHPYSIPEDIKKFLDLESGDNRGRIYRLVHQDSQTPGQPVADLSKFNLKQLVAQLNSDNGWVRETAHRLIGETTQKQDAELTTLLDKFTANNPSGLGLAHAVWCLRSTSNPVRNNRWTQTIQDSGNPNVLRQWLRRLGSDHSEKDAQTSLSSLVARAAKSKSTPLRFEAALQLQRLSLESADGLQQTLMSLIEDKDPLVRNAAAMVVNTPSRARNYLHNLARSKSSSAANPTIVRIAVSDVLAGNVKEVLEILQALELPAQVALLKALDVAVRKQGFELSDVADLRIKHPKISESFTEPNRLLLAQHIDSLRQIAVDPQASLAQRIMVVDGLRVASPDVARRNVLRLVGPQVPESLQIAAVQSVLSVSSSFHESIVERWKSLGSAVRAAFIEQQLQQIATTSQLLTSISEGQIARTAMPVRRRQFLLNHANSKIAAQAQRLYSGDLNPDRAAAVRNYQPVLNLVGNVDRGALLFKKNCSVCHRAGKTGHAVGPDIASVKNKSAADLLISILDPNREAQPNFTSYTVITNGGRVMNGMIAEQNAATLTLKRAESKSDVVQRQDIDELVSSGKSLMPDGLEKELKEPQTLADVIAFIKSQKGNKSK